MSTEPLPPPIDRAAVTPSVDDVAILLRTRTVGSGSLDGGLGGETGPTDSTTFTTDTRPTAIEAAAVIELAADEVLGSLPAAVEVRLYPAIERLVGLRAAALIETSFFRESGGEIAVALNTSYTTGLAALAKAAPGDVAIASGLPAREDVLVPLP